MGIFFALHKHMNCVGYVLRVMLAVMCLASGAGAYDVTDFKVNDDRGRTEQSFPRIAVVADGSFVITWIDKRSGDADVYLQRFRASGQALGGNRKINDDTVMAYQAEPAIAADLSGLYSVVWRDYRTGIYPFDPNIFFQRFDSSLSPVQDNLNLTANIPDSLKESPDIALSPWGTGVVVWADYRNNNWDIFAQRIAANGALIGSNFMVNDDVTAAQQHSPRVAVGSTGWFVVAWYDDRFGDDDIIIQKYDSSGAPIGVNLRLNVSSSAYRQAYPAVAADASGGITVVWTDWRNGVYPANPDIYYRKYDSLMAAVTNEVLLNGDNTYRAQKSPAIAVDRMGLTTAVWADSGTGSWDISGRMIDANGTVMGSNFEGNLDPDSNQLHPDVAVDGFHRYVTWTDKRNGNFDIYASVTEYNSPALLAEPTSLKFSQYIGGSAPAPETLIISHEGLTPLNFTTQCSHDWLEVTPAGGLTPDTLQVSISTDTLPGGVYLGGITLVDTDNGDSTVIISVRLDVTIQDTVTVGSAMVGLEEQSSVPITLSVGDGITNLNLPLKYDTVAIVPDSVVFSSGLPGIIDHAASIQTANGHIFITVDTNQADTFLAAGDYLLAELHFTSRDTDISSEIDTAIIGTNSAYVVALDRTQHVLGVMPGQVVVGTPTDIEDDPWDASLPDQFRLEQNYPNPFNMTTRIEYELPRPTEVELTVFNVLGQQVRTVVSGMQSAGPHACEWDGRSESGREVPSGIYFYRLSADSQSDVRKMVLVK